MYVSVCLCVCLCVSVCLSLATYRPLDLSRPVLASLCLSESKPITQPPHLQLGEQHTPQQRGPSPALQAHRQQIHDAPVPCNTMQLQQRQNEGKVVNELQDTKHTIKHAHIQTMHISLLGLRKDLMAGVQPSKKTLHKTCSLVRKQCPGLLKSYLGELWVNQSLRILTH